jgi:hypothetical protein
MVLAVAAAACASGEGGGDDATSTATEQATPEATATQKPSPAEARRTSIEAIDAAIDAVLAGDREALLALVDPQTRPCNATPAQDLDPGPHCSAGTPDGSAVKVIPYAQCEGVFAPPEAAIDFMLRSLRPGSVLYAAYVVPPGAIRPGEMFSGDYLVIFSREVDAGRVFGWSLFMTSRGISGISAGCASSPQEFIDSRGLTEALLAPP